MTPGAHAPISQSCAKSAAPWPSVWAARCRFSPWGCLRISKWPSKKARRKSASAPRCSGAGQQTEPEIFSFHAVKEQDRERQMIEIQQRENAVVFAVRVQ